MSERYLIDQQKCGIQVGDTVRIMAKAESGERGWADHWNHEMNNQVGKDGVVEYMSLSGVRLVNNFSYPFFVLSIVKKGNRN